MVVFSNYLQLLKRNPANRLGSGVGDAKEIKKHPFFAEINWDDVYNRKLPASLLFIKKSNESNVNVAPSESGFVVQY